MFRIAALCLSLAALPHCLQIDDGGDAATWGTAQSIHNQGDEPVVAIDSSGNITTVWTQGSDGAWTARFAVGEGWGSGAPISGGNLAGSARVGVDGSGNAIAIWLRLFDNQVLANRRRQDTGSWANPVRVSEGTPGSDADKPDLAVSANSTAISVWTQPSDNRESNDIWASRFAGAWDLPVEIELRDGLDLSTPKVAIDPSGNGMAIWSERTGDRFDVYYNVYRPTAWEGEERLDTPSADAEDPQVGLDGLGHAVAVWTQSARPPQNPPPPRRVWASRYSLSDRAWEAPRRIGPAAESDASTADLAVAADGTAVAAWVQGDGIQSDEIWVSWYTSNNGWAQAQRIGFSDPTSDPAPSAAVHSQNGALVAWEARSAGARIIQSSYYTPAAGWGEATAVAPDQPGIASKVQVQMYGRSQGAAVWNADIDNRTEIWANRLE